MNTDEKQLTLARMRSVPYYIHICVGGEDLSPQEARTHVEDETDIGEAIVDMTMAGVREMAEL